MNALALTLLLLPAADPKPMEWTVDGVKRQALVAVPAKSDAHPPLVFAFHGLGGNMRNSSRTFHIHSVWPEAVVVYPQGLPLTTRNDDQAARPGWQRRVGELNDRDLKFFDAVVNSMKQDHKIDEKRIYVTGHSNGGYFTYLLANARPNLFAAVAPSAAIGQARDKYQPLPLIHVAGEKDTTVPFEAQKRTIDAVKAANGCESTGTEWAKGCTLYKSGKGAPLVTFIHSGDHKYPTEAPALIVKFFKEHERGK